MLLFVDCHCSSVMVSRSTVSCTAGLVAMVSCTMGLVANGLLYHGFGSYKWFFVLWTLSYFDSWSVTILGLVRWDDNLSCFASTNHRGCIIGSLGNRGLPLYFFITRQLNLKFPDTDCKWQEREIFFKRCLKQRGVVLGTEHDMVKLSTVQILQPQSDRLHHHMWRYCVCVWVGGWACV